MFSQNLEIKMITLICLHSSFIYSFHRSKTNKLLILASGFLNMVLYHFTVLFVCGVT